MRSKEDALEKKMQDYSDKMDRAKEELEPLPEPDEHGMVALSYQRLRRLVNQRSKICFYDGFFYGIVCPQTYSEK